MKTFLMPLVLSSLLTVKPISHVKSAIAPHQNEAATTAGKRPSKLSFWINRKTRPIGKAFEKVLPFRLVKRERFMGACCFPADTRITLPGGVTCAISELRVGQAVLSCDPATNVLGIAEIEALATVVHDSLRQLSFADGRTVMATSDHPFWVKDSGWASLAPTLTTARYSIGATQLLSLGDDCLVFNGTAQLTPTRLSNVITLTACGVTTYTITRLSRGNMFFANGLVVGVEDEKSKGSRSPKSRFAKARL